MDNKTIFQEKNVRLNNNNDELNNIIDIINSLPSVGEIKLQEKTISPSTHEQETVADDGYDGLSKVKVNAVTNEIDSNIQPENIKKGVSILNIVGTHEGGTAVSGTIEITENGDHDVSEYATASVNVPSFEPTGEITITENGSYPVRNYNTAIVNVEGAATRYAPRYISFTNYTGADLSDELENLDCSNLTTTASMFSSCANLTEVVLNNQNISNVTNMSSMFTGCSKITNVELLNVNTSNVKDVGSMFSNCTSLLNVDLSSFNTANVTEMDYMFSTCSKLPSINVTNFDTSKCTKMNYMFQRCQTLTSLDLSNFNTVNVTNMSSMLAGCSNLLEADLRNFTIKNTCQVGYMFSECKALQKIDFRNATISTSISNYTGMFNAVPSDCLIIVKDASIQSWIKSKFSNLTNVKTLDEHLAEGGV